MTTHSPWAAAQAPISFTMAGGYTAPVGLDGDTNSRTLVRGVRAASRSSTLARKPERSSVRTGTVTPPASAIDSG